MDHVCYLDIKSEEYKKLVEGTKTMIIRGGNRKIIPFKTVFSGDTIFFVDDKNYEKVILKANVLSVFNFSELTQKESYILINKYQHKLQLTDHHYKKCAGKAYIALIEVNNVEKIQPFNFDSRGYELINGWMLIGNRINEERKMNELKKDASIKCANGDELGIFLNNEGLYLGHFSRVYMIENKSYYDINMCLY